MTLMLAGLCLVAVYNYRNLFNKKLRAAILASFVVSGLIPATHWYLIVSDNSQFRKCLCLRSLALASSSG